MKSMKKQVLVFLALAVVGAGFIYVMNQAFNQQGLVKSLFCGAAPATEVLGEVEPGSPDSLAMRDEMFGRISMLIFSAITVLQFFAFALAATVLSGIRSSTESFKLRLKRLENADIFFDVPLYVGLFGTVSAFLVMTFSPQSSRLIAYSSTLIGIIFSLILRLVLLYPLRQKLLGGNESSEGSAK